MPIKLRLAKQRDDREGAKVSLSFWYEDTPTKPQDDREGAKVSLSFFGTRIPLLQRHKLTLHEDDNGIWHPELDLCIHQCGARDPQALLVALADVLHKASLSLCDAEVVVDLVGMVATKKGV